MPSPMPCPRCRDANLKPAMTRQGVEVDACPSCRGVWLDRGELFSFARRPKPLIAELRRALSRTDPGELKSPKTGQPMERIKLFDQVELDYDRDTGGLWTDHGEIQQVVAASEAGLQMSLEPTAFGQTGAALGGIASAGPSLVDLPAYAAGAKPMPNLFVRSVSLLALLYALLGGILIAMVELGGLSAGGAVAIGIVVAALQFLLGPFLMDWSLSWFYHCRWTTPEALPEHLRAFIGRVTAERKMKFPRIGIIDDGGPNAFTYGHTPNNARIVITRGLQTLLSPGELEAVVAHEIGHAKNWDMLIMTAAYLVPLIAYYLYRTMIRIRVRGKDKTAAARWAIALGAYLVYIISEYIVLWLSRTREFKADNFSGEVTRDPNLLAGALVKIGYGLAGRDQKKDKEQQQEQGVRSGKLEALGALGIFDAGSARALAIGASRQGTGGFDPDNLKGAMRWDLWNPWAKFYELNSTHPLIASRLDYLSRQSAKLGQQPLVTFDEKKPESYWDEFLVDLFFLFLPVLAGGGLLAAGLVRADQRLMLLAISGFGLGMLLKTLFSYRAGAFPDMTVAGLLKNVKVSGVRGVPCTISGTVIGRGVPGLLWSEDFVVQDDTGILFLDYRQPLHFLDLIFGLMRGRQMQGTKIQASGWYRRSPVPFLELKTFKSDDGKTRRCYSYHAKLVIAVGLIVLGVILALKH